MSKIQIRQGGDQIQALPMLEIDFIDATDKEASNFVRKFGVVFCLSAQISNDFQGTPRGESVFEKAPIVPRQSKVDRKRQQPLTGCFKAIAFFD